MTTYDFYKTLIENALKNAISDDSYLPINILNESMRYSLLAGGKRLRPILVLEFCRICGGKWEKAIPAAIGIEMLHTYSLIHDDLPVMDNDELRRGKPTNHIVYGECVALLAGDSLQSEAFNNILLCDLPAQNVLNCARIFSTAVGRKGMCGGQFLDMEWENRQLSQTELDNINSRKTGALISAACQMGVALAGGNELQLKAAYEYGRALGEAFQIRDDILDVISSVEELGKPIGSDKEKGKNTYMYLLGEEKCLAKISELTKAAKCAIINCFSDSEFLISLADSLAIRNR